MAKNIHLLVIDPQDDFCNPNGGTLCVPGADKDMERLALMLHRIGDKIDDVHVTLDSHQPLHIAHPIMWVDRNGRHPNPFTIITADEVKDGRWRTTRLTFQRRATEYVEALARNGRYPLCIWPPHCLIGSKGQAIFQPFYDALRKWCEGEMGTVDFVTKGSNILTEHYSAIVADVPDPSDPSTQMNVNFLTTVNEADVVLLAGEASSHCVANTGIDACNYFADDSLVRKLVLLEDAMSPVPGFEAQADAFKRELQKRGCQIAKTTDYLI